MTEIAVPGAAIGVKVRGRSRDKEREGAGGDARLREPGVEGRQVASASQLRKKPGWLSPRLPLRAEEWPVRRRAPLAG